MKTKLFKVSYWIDGHKHVSVCTATEAKAFFRDFMRLGFVFGCEPL